MPVSKKFIHDRLVLLLITANTFLTIITTILILLRLDPSRSTGYFVQYRSNLGLNGYKSGPTSGIISFIVFSVLVLIFHIFLSKRLYSHRRHFAIVVLGFGTLLLILSLIVSNALLLL